MVLDRAARWAHVDVTFLRLIGEGHGYSEDASQAHAAQLQAQFFVEHLIEADVPLPPRGGTIYLPVAHNGEQ